MKVAICHRGFAGGDAIGNDMAGMYRLFERFGLDPVVVCDWDKGVEGFRIQRPDQIALSSFDVIIYHHSFYWPLAETLIGDLQRPIIMRYHHVTPPHFFDAYSSRYVDLCQRGHQQTRQFIRRPNDIWLADSGYNREDLISKGLDPGRISVVPPFNRLGAFLKRRNTAEYNGHRIELLFVGRFSPNKGHEHIIRIARAFVADFNPNVLLRIVGASDLELERYNRQLQAIIIARQLQDRVEVVEKCTDEELIELFERSHIYLTCSEHEGFCVPLIEAQAIGLPVIAADVCAVRETAGQNQLIAPPPKNRIDYSVYAGLINEVVHNRALREEIVSAGYKNAWDRFTDEPIENCFVEEIYDSLRQL